MIWLTQWKCPSNHTALALAWDDAEDVSFVEETDALLKHRDAIVEQGEGYFARRVLRRWCGICGRYGIAGAPIELRVVHRLTAFRTTEEATPALKTLMVQKQRGN